MTGRKATVVLCAIPGHHDHDYRDCLDLTAGREETADCDRSAVCLADQHEPSCISQMSWADRAALGSVGQEASRSPDDLDAVEADTEYVEALTAVLRETTDHRTTVTSTDGGRSWSWDCTCGVYSTRHYARSGLALAQATRHRQSSPARETT